MTGALTIARRETSALFNTPVGWIALTAFTFIGGFFVALPMLLLARDILVMILGESFNDATQVMVFFILSESFRGHASAAAGLLVGQGCQWPYLLLKVSVLLFTAVGVVTLGKTMGAVGVALVQCIMSLYMMLFITTALAIQAKSVKCVFVGNDMAALARLASWRNHR